MIQLCKNRIAKFLDSFNLIFKMMKETQYTNKVKDIDKKS